MTRVNLKFEILLAPECRPTKEVLRLKERIESIRMTHVVKPEEPTESWATLDLLPAALKADPAAGRLSVLRAQTRRNGVRHHLLHKSLDSSDLSLIDGEFVTVQILCS